LDKGAEYEEAYAQEFLDGLNLFYVATTRPVHRLYINSARKSGNRISELLYNFVTKDNELSFPIKYQFGKTYKVKIDREDQAVEGFTYNPNPNLCLEITSQHMYESSNSSSERKWGELLHQALELIQTKEEIQPYAKRLKLQGKLAANQESLFCDQLLSTITHPDMKDWFSGDCLEMKEREIIDENGDTYRPDRIILYPGQTIILDFKTGTPRNKDEQQIKKYNDLLNELGYSNIKNYLFYIENGDLVKVNIQ
jgi:ATP-dependent exoDNAse (exonuclease V) beta subunit